MSEKHTLSVLVENKPGVLTRVSALFTRRGFNIHSLAVGPTEHEDISRITVIADAEGLAMEQVTPVLAEVITQGVAEGTFNTERPHDVIELLLSRGDLRVGLRAR